LSKYDDLRFIFSPSKSGDFGASFHKNPLHKLCWILLGCQVVKIRQKRNAGYYHGFFVFQFFEVGGLMIIHKRTLPNLATDEMR
jgi:hypothetical protein